MSNIPRCGGDGFCFEVIAREAEFGSVIVMEVKTGPD